MLRFLKNRASSRKRSKDFGSKSNSGNNSNRRINSSSITSESAIPSTSSDLECSFDSNKVYYQGSDRKPRYSSINALESRDCPPEIVQYQRPPENLTSPVRASSRADDDKPSLTITNSGPKLNIQRKYSGKKTYCLGQQACGPTAAAAKADSDL